jgi:5-methylcytosine-specific restriction endonuclease McrBC GTP-binding regulatory subunit McrB
MNTADRSIRSLDAALRRRTEIFELGPSADILESYYQNNELQLGSLIDGFRALNGRLEAARDRHHTIGHTFFMAPNFGLSELNRVWTRRVRPLIEEYFIDEQDLVAEFSPHSFWPA